MSTGLGQPDPALDTRDLHCLLSLLEACERAPTLQALQEETLEGLARHFGYRDATFFVGPTLEDLFCDGLPLVTGVARPMVNQYLEEFHRHDPFFTLPTAQQLLFSRGVVSLDHLSAPFPPEQRRYLDRFLFHNKVHAKVVIRLGTGRSGAAAMGLLQRESGAFGRRDLALAALLGQHIGNLVRIHLRFPEPPAAQRPPLSPRQADVVRLVAQGFTNRQMADTLYVTVDTVKKHLTRALDVTGCTNRTQLAVHWRRIGPIRNQPTDAVQESGEAAPDHPPPQERAVK